MELVHPALNKRNCGPDTRSTIPRWSCDSQHDLRGHTQNAGFTHLRLVSRAQLCSEPPWISTAPYQSCNQAPHCLSSLKTLKCHQDVSEIVVNSMLDNFGVPEVNSHKWTVDLVACNQARSFAIFDISLAL